MKRKKKKNEKEKKEDKDFKKGEEKIERLKEAVAEYSMKKRAAHCLAN